MSEEEGSGRPEFKVEVEEEDSATVLHISGHITEIEADELGSQFDQLFEDGQYNLVLDLGDVDFMSSSGLGQIMRAYRTAQKNSGSISLARVQPLVADVFRVTKLDQLLEMHDTVQGALGGAE